jgi:hypothetical protein
MGQLTLASSDGRRRSRDTLKKHPVTSPKERSAHFTRTRCRVIAIELNPLSLGSHQLVPGSKLAVKAARGYSTVTSAVIGTLRDREESLAAAHALQLSASTRSTSSLVAGEKPQLVFRHARKVHSPSVRSDPTR